MSELLQKQNISTRAEGDQVVLRIGNSEIKFDYITAFKIAQFLRMSGKEAKKNAGDIGRHWSTIGVLTDAEG